LESRQCLDRRAVGPDERGHIADQWVSLQQADRAQLIGQRRDLGGGRGRTDDDARDRILLLLIRPNSVAKLIGAEPMNPAP